MTIEGITPRPRTRPVLKGSSPSLNLVTLEYEPTLAIFKRLAAEQPNRISPSKTYAEDIIGATLRELGFENFELIEDKHMHGTSQHIFEAHLKTHTLLAHIQRNIDKQKSWSKAVEIAERWVNNHPDAWSWVDWPLANPTISEDDKREAATRAW